MTRSEKIKGYLVFVLCFAVLGALPVAANMVNHSKENGAHEHHDH